MAKKGHDVEATAGLKDGPKLKALLLGAEISRKVVLKALTAPSIEWTEVESHEVQRLVARLRARGADGEPS